MGKGENRAGAINYQVGEKPKRAMKKRERSMTFLVVEEQAGDAKGDFPRRADSRVRWDRGKRDWLGWEEEKHLTGSSAQANWLRS